VARPAQPGKVLRGGEFYSPVRARISADDAVLSDLCQPVARSVPRHEHELAYVTIVLHGDYLEGDRGKLEELRPSARFLIQRELHIPL